MKAPLAALLLMCLNAPAFAADNPVGFQTTTLPDTHNNRPLEMAVWY
ncbi:dienelactone hydrolase, partial [Pseudomonas carnis]|nr:dienelactone hydrolase [Pseudomonas carnis]